MIDFVKFVYRGILTGMPILTYNSITKNTFNVPMTVNPISSYINFKLNDTMVEMFNNDIQKTSNLSLVPIKLFPDSKEEYILSVNYYNCSNGCINCILTRFDCCSIYLFNFLMNEKYIKNYNF